MAAYFFDSSALAKLYHPEVGTPEMDKIVQTPGSQVRISRLTVVEIPSVFAIKVRTRFISQEDARLLVRQFQEDFLAGPLELELSGEDEASGFNSAQ